ncbi:MAG: hypothetical protein HC910_02900 [Spirulinaceae cyanobacterium SM2_1_0]|nr:hypothetical protein [Spirulinaceae cyanobacterium SM2_1_0]
MNTPAHVAINLLLLGRRDVPPVLVPVVIGAILPDAPMFLFYFVEKVVRRTPESVIWQQAYHQAGWQNFFDIFNSVPFIVVGMLLALWANSQWGLLLGGSMLLHIAGDLPLHHDDAHRHFLPLTNWRFQSPVSYWDPNHYGAIAAPLEILAVILSCIVLLQLYTSPLGRLCIGTIGVLYLAYFAYILVVWI